MPERIQLRRTKGWKMPLNTVKVDRTTKWGNPFNFRRADYCWVALSYGCRGDAMGRQEASVKAFEEWINPPDGAMTASFELQPKMVSGDKEADLGPRVSAGRAPTHDEIRATLKGKNLACWCPIGSPCHADELLRIANMEAAE